MKHLGAWTVTAGLISFICGCHGDLGGSSNTPTTETVPDVVGNSEAAAAAATLVAGLKVGTVTSQSSATVAAGDVISESPAAGTSVATGSLVNLTVSSGPPAGFAYIADSGADVNGFGAISAYSIDAMSGGLSALASSPIEVAGSKQLYQPKVDPSGRYLYAVDLGANAVFAFAIDQDNGSLTAVSGSPFATGNAPASLAFDSTGSYLYVANGNDGTISAYALNTSSGALTQLSNSPYALSGTGTEPQQLVTAGNYLYVVETGANAVDVFSIASGTGQLTEGVAGSPFATDVQPYGIAVDPGGAVLYTANSANGSGSISAFTINSTTGVLTPAAGSPQAIPASGNISIDPHSQYLFVTESGGAAVYPIDTATAVLGAAVPGSPFTTGGTTAYSISIDPSDQFVYVSNYASSNVAEFTLDSSTGVLTAVTGSPVVAGAKPTFIAIQ
jgi:6-phosphogluconolactonase